MKKPPDMPGLSQKRFRALEDACCEADLKSMSDKRRKEYEAKREAAAALAPARGARPKRKRARHAGVRAGVGAEATANAGEADWPFSNNTVNAFAEMTFKRIAPRMLAQEARQAGDLTARPRDYR